MYTSYKDMHLHFLTLSFITVAHSLKCWDCHSDDGKDCEDTSTNTETTCQSENDSCSKVIVGGSKFYVNS